MTAEQRAMLRDQLIIDEGLRLKPYKDTKGILTIGVGRNLDDVGISHDEAMALLDTDIANHAADLDRELPWWSRLDDARQLVLANMAFNLGIQRLLLFKKMLDHLARGEYDAAADEMQASSWAGQVGPRATRLIATMRGGMPSASSLA
jgi:lysozyme